jgi:hypothetical protein
MNPNDVKPDEVFSLVAGLLGIDPKTLAQFVSPHEVEIIYNEEALAQSSLQRELDYIHNTLKKEEPKMVQKLAGVVCLDNLTKNAHQQFIAQSGMKVLHGNEAQAVAEAERLARANPGKSFGTFVLTSVSTVTPSITTRV